MLISSQINTYLGLLLMVFGIKLQFKQKGCSGSTIFYLRNEVPFTKLSRNMKYLYASFNTCNRENSFFWLWVWFLIMTLGMPAIFLYTINCSLRAGYVINYVLYISVVTVRFLWAFWEGLFYRNLVNDRTQLFIIIIIL